MYFIVNIIRYIYKTIINYVLFVDKIVKFKTC